MGIRRQLHDHIDAALDDDPRQALWAVRRLIDEELPWLEQRAVRLARRNGFTWAMIARLLQRSRQAVQRRFRAADATSLRPPSMLLTSAGRLDATMTEAHRLRQRRLEAEQLDRDDVDVVPW